MATLSQHLASAESGARSTARGYPGPSQTSSSAAGASADATPSNPLLAALAAMLLLAPPVKFRSRAKAPQVDLLRDIVSSEIEDFFRRSPKSGSKIALQQLRKRRLDDGRDRLCGIERDVHELAAA